VILFIIAALFVYRRHVAAGLSKNYVANNEFTSDGAAKSADVYFFYTTWCPHCKTAKPIWNDFKNEMSDKTVNGITINFFEVDCDKDPETTSKFNVKGFPTIKLVNGNQIIEYDAKPNKTHLIEFLNSSLA
jgi:thioredoxin domain-containing protein 10